MPSDAKLENGLRSIVGDLFQQGNLEDLTVKRVRASCEAKLKLPKDFFKNDEAWKDKSKDIIQREVDAHNDEQVESVPEPAIKQSPSASPQVSAQSRKRKSHLTSPPESRKKRRSSSLSAASGRGRDEDSSTRATEGETKTVTGRLTDSGTKKSREPKPPASPPSEADGSESDLSVLIDEEPKAKKKRRSKSDDKPKKKSQELSKTKKAPDVPADADAEEIKRLQGWLVKCGIRKMWFKELAPYDTPKAKIRHLRDMLADAGMTGRYSKEKAEQIREERELKADLEAVTEGNKSWGKDQDDEEEQQTGGRARRKLARGFQGLDFLNDDDGEETD